MLKRLTIALALFIVLATTAVAQVVMPGSQPNPALGMAGIEHYGRCHL